MAQAGDGQAELPLELREIMADEVAQLDALEMLPDAFVRIHLRRIAWQALQQQTLALLGSEEVLHRLRAVNRGAVPQDQQLALDLPQQVAQKAHDRRAPER